MVLASLLMVLGSWFVLGTADLPDPNSYASMGWIIAGVFGIVGLANQGMALWDRLDRKSVV